MTGTHRSVDTPWPPQARRTPRGRRVAGLISLLLFFSASAYGVFYLFHDHPRFAVARVVMEGVPPAKQAETEAVSDTWIGQPLLFVDIEGATAGFAAKPWVESVTIRRVLPDTLLLRIKPKAPMALALRAGELWTIDRWGNWLSPHGGRPASRVEDFAIIDAGPESKSADVALGASFVSRIQEDDPALYARISEVEVLSDGFGVVDRVAKIRILFGRNALAANEAAAAWRALLAVKPELDRHALTRGDVDLRFSGRIVLRAPAEVPVRGKT